MNGLTNGGQFHYVPFYGRLPVISNDEYTSGDWVYEGTDFGDDEDDDFDDEYSVCYSPSKGCYACVII